MAKQTPIKIYRSSVSGNVPSAVNLDYGELALNYADGRLYFKDASNNVRTIASTAAFLLTGEYRFDNSTSAADPGTGDIRLDNSTWAATTNLYVDTITGLGNDATLILQSLVAGDLIILQDRTTAVDHVKFRVNAAATDNTGWWTIPVDYISSSGTFWANHQNLVVIIQHSDTTPADHNDLTGLQGGTATEYYHMTSAEYTGTGTGNFVRMSGPDIISAKLALAVAYDPGFLATFGFRDSGGVGHDLMLAPLNDPTGDTWLYLPDGGGPFDYETLARLSDIPAAYVPSMARHFAFMGA